MEQRVEESNEVVWLTIEEAAERARVSVHTLRRAYYRGDLRVTSSNGGRTPKKFRPEWIDAWLDGNAAGGEQ